MHSGSDSDDEDAGEPARRARRARQVTPHPAVAVGRREFDEPRVDAPVVARDLLRCGKLRTQRFEQHRGGDATDRVFGDAVEEAPAVDLTMDVAVEPAQHFGMEIGRFPAFHRIPPPRPHGRLDQDTGNDRRFLARIPRRARAQAYAAAPAAFQNRRDAMRAPSAIAAIFAQTTSGSTAACPTHVP